MENIEVKVKLEVPGQFPLNVTGDLMIGAMKKPDSENEVETFVAGCATVYDLALMTESITQSIYDCLTRMGLTRTQAIDAIQKGVQSAIASTKSPILQPKAAEVVPIGSILRGDRRG